MEEIIESTENTIKEKLDEIEKQYNSIIARLEQEVQDDRVHAQNTYKTIKNMVGDIRSDGGIVGPGILQALNSAVTNLQNSTQREKEILQEIAKKQQQLETLYELTKEPDEDDFNKNDFID